MRIDIHHHHYTMPDPALLRSVRNLETRVATIMKTLDQLLTQGTAMLAQVKKNSDLEGSIIAIVNAQAAQLNDLRAQLAAAGNDAAKLAALGDVMDQLADQTREQGEAAAAAAIANTPAAADAPADAVDQKGTDAPATADDGAADQSGAGSTR